MPNELKPCPFCGGKAILEHEKTHSRKARERVGLFKAI